MFNNIFRLCSWISVTALALLLAGCGTYDSTAVVAPEELKFVKKHPDVGVARVGKYFNDGKLRIFENEQDVYIYVYSNNMGSGSLFGLKNSTSESFYGNKQQARKLADQRIKQMGLSLMADNPNISPGSNVYHEVSLKSGIEVLIRPYKSDVAYRSYRVEIIDYSAALAQFKQSLKTREIAGLGQANFHYLQPFLDKEIIAQINASDSEPALAKLTSVLNKMSPVSTKNHCMMEKRQIEIELSTDFNDIQTQRDVTAWHKKRKRTADRCYKVTRKKLIANETPKAGDLHQKWDWTYYKGDYIQGEVGANWVKISKNIYAFSPETMTIGYISKRDVTPVIPKVSKSLIARVNGKRSNIQNQIARDKDRKAFNLAKNAGSIASYQQYLNHYPKGEFSQQATNNLESLFVEYHSFNGYMNAYRLTAKNIHLNHAHQAVVSSSSKVEVASKLLENYFDSRTKYLRDIPSFFDMASNIANFEQAKYFRKSMQVSGFGQHLNRPERFFDSVEYRYVLKYLTPATKLRFAQEQYFVDIKYGDSTFPLSFDGSCKFLREESGTRDTGIIESIFTLGADKATYYNNVYSCQAQSADIASIERFSQTLGNSQAYSELANKTDWQYRTTSRGTDYQYESYASSGSSSTYNEPAASTSPKKSDRGYRTDGDGRLYFNGKEFANLDYSYGWKILCSNRRHGKVRLISDKSKEQVIEMAKYECKH
ncbi:hypothetical protein [Aliiglaciecola sp. LCG003]|uniref:hypothetical protein n=1 Tax=Aliiglaciecola sp. LCG003 TaxID=3053655 RepID=UPI00257265AA|nr:hypothetical protein [Aliiglaciecola sp. LCG003]WJG09409.1 hypothetical protein QR722_19100 [Aliiglaciecola sp. LCG003]